MGKLDRNRTRVAVILSIVISGFVIMIVSSMLSQVLLSPGGTLLLGFGDLLAGAMILGSFIVLAIVIFIAFYLFEDGLDRDVY